MSTGPKSQPSFDEREWDACVALTQEAHERIAAGDVERGLALSIAASERLLPVVGGAHPDYAQALVAEGDALSALGQIGSSEERFSQALFILDGFIGEDAEGVRRQRLSVLARLGYLWSLAGQYAKADAMLREALAVASALYGEGALELAEHFNTLGLCLRFEGRYAEAAEAYLRAGAVRDAHGIAQPASHFQNLSGLANACEDFASAQRYAVKAIAARLAESGEGFELGTDLCALGDALVGLGATTEAEASYRRALSIYAASPRADHPEVAFALHNLGDALTALERNEEAESAYREAIARKRLAFGDSHHEVAATLNNLAALLFDVGRRDEALRMADEAERMVTGTLESSHPVRSGVEAFAQSLGAGTAAERAATRRRGRPGR